MTWTITPGTFRAERKRGTYLGESNPAETPWVVVGNEGQGWTALVGSEKDAQLYAAARALLEALKELLPHLDNEHHISADRIRRQAEIDRARAAIALAEGQP